MMGATAAPSPPREELGMGGIGRLRPGAGLRSVGLVLSL
jgi:hypothetical protein